MLENYSNEIKLSVSVCLLLAYVFQVCRIYHSQRTRNRLSFIPYIIIMAFIVAYILDELVSVLSSHSDSVPISDKIKQGQMFIMGNICCFLWSALLIVQAMEWELITQLISFQTRIPLSEMDVKRQHYIENKEQLTYKIFVGLNILNLVFHIIKIVLCIFWMTGAWN